MCLYYIFGVCVFIDVLVCVFVNVCLSLAAAVGRPSDKPSSSLPVPVGRISRSVRKVICLGKCACVCVFRCLHSLKELHAEELRLSC